MRYLITLLFASLSLQLYAQEAKQRLAPIPVELMVGDDGYFFMISLNRPISPGSKFGFFTQLSYLIDHKKEVPNSINTEAMGTYTLDENFNLAAGTRLNSFTGFKPLLAVSYNIFNKNIGLFIQPSIEIHKDGFFEFFGFFEWHPNYGKKINPFFRLQLLSDFDDEHIYSYHLWRVGIKYKNLAFGPAANFRYLGPEGNDKHNYGVFLRLSL
ncbi:hypothetical protein [Pontimicrobium sp. IMCC45349]|uniref:hypothetical protein n=1 Tax=Pontimicrobium sp. IMCC45349 TaxID=3391574 RepID=UPI0039A0DE94